MNLSFLTNSRAWKRFGLTEIWNWGLFWFTATLLALLSYTFDAVRLNNFSSAWIPINFISFTVSLAFTVVVVLVARARKIKHPYMTVVNFLVAAISMGLKNVLTFLLCVPFGIEDKGNVFSRFLGGTVIGLATFIVYGSIVSGRIERVRSLEDLYSKERALVGFRENVTELFIDEEQELRDRTRRELLPRFEALQQKVELGLDGKSLTSDLLNLLTKEVRPLSAEIARAAQGLSRLVPQSLSESKKLPEVKISLFKMVQPFRSFVLTAFAWWFGVAVAIPNPSLNESMIAALVYLVCLTLLRFALLPFKPVTTFVALVVLTGVALLAPLESYYLLYQQPHTPSQSPLIAATYVTGGITVLIFGHAHIFDLSRVVLEDRLKKVVNQFTRDNKLFEQKLWIARHVWYTVLHGSVQSALTAASIRASHAKTLTDADRQAILLDLNRAMDALRNPTKQNVSLDESFESLRQTWEGICQIELASKPEATKALVASTDLSLVTNEILKEAVSNAVKHGGSGSVKIHISLDEDLGNLEILVSNDGTKPKENTGSGVGSLLFETLCTTHQLRWNNQTNTTELFVVIPVA